MCKLQSDVTLQTDRYAVFGSEHCHSFDVFICDVGGDDQDGGIRVTQLIGAVHLTDGPALIRKTLTHKSPNTWTKNYFSMIKTIAAVYISLYF